MQELNEEMQASVEENRMWRKLFLSTMEVEEGLIYECFLAIPSIDFIKIDPFEYLHKLEKWERIK